MIKDRLKSLRQLMKKEGIHAYLVPSTDPHQDEYLPKLWQRRQWLSGFTGSAGELLITRDNAGLWTDSRYFLQAEQQLKGSGIQLFKSGLPDTPSIQEWIRKQLKAGQAAGTDPRLLSIQEAETFKDYLSGWGISLKPVEKNLVDEVWKERPAMPDNPAEPYPVKYAGEATDSKLERLQKEMKNEKADFHIITTLDAIAWLFNIRGKDIEYNPLAIGYAIVSDRDAMLFIKASKVTRSLKKHLGKKISIYDYKHFTREVKKIDKSGKKIWLDPSTVSWWVTQMLGKKCELFFQESPLTLMKAIKNNIQITGLRTSQVRDGVAMVRFLHWLEKNIDAIAISEISAAKMLEKFRTAQDLFQGLSFETISAYREHGAIVHYSSTAETDIMLKKEDIYLIDSGAHYLDGTTDITRTVALGEPSAEQKDRFTRVLQGHIRLAMTRFPRGTAGNQLDTIARKPLWNLGLNYGHGTGHGIGSYLNVHEGPQAISYYRGLGVALQPGMIISNEPGYYQTGDYGIRIENLILTVKDDKFSSEQSEFYTFETVTLCPIDLKLIEKSLLLPQEVNWLNQYHEEVRKKLSPHLGREEKEWLAAATRAI
jgi:Xaa-Pro aminopeptidase